MSCRQKAIGNGVNEVLDKSIKNRYKNLTNKSAKRGIEPPVYSEIAYLIRSHFRNGWDCYYCGKPMVVSNGVTKSHNEYTIDHKTPLSRGGGNEVSNLCLCCHMCNYVKGQHVESEFKKWFSIEKDNEGVYITNITNGVVYTQENYHDAY